MTKECARKGIWHQLGKVSKEIETEAASSRECENLRVGPLHYGSEQCDLETSSFTLSQYSRPDSWLF